MSDVGAIGLRSAFSPPPTLLIVLVLFVVSLVAFQDFSFPLSLLDGSSSNEQLLSEQAKDGSIWRRMSIPVIGLLGLYLLGKPHDHPVTFVSPLGLLLVAYVTWILTSLMWSEAPELTLRRLFVFLFLLTGAVGIATLDVSAIRIIFVRLTLANLAMGLVNELFLGTFHPFSGAYRFSGTVHPNLQASIAAQLALTGLCCALDPDTRRSWTAPLLVALGTTVVLLTQSRTALICLVLASSIVVTVWAWRRAAAAILIVVVLGGIIASSMMLAEAVSPETSPVAAVLSMLEKPRDEGNIEALTGRTDIWETLIDFAMIHPVTGVGFDSFWTPERILEISLLHQWGINQAHSVYIEHLVSLGLVGLALWCFLILGAFVVATRQYVSGRSPVFLWMAGQIAFCIVHGFSESINMMVGTSGFVLISLLAHLALYRDGQEGKTG